METYLTVKSILTAVALIGASSLFFMRVKRLVRLMTTVQGRRPVALDRLPERLRVLFTDVLGQASVRRKRLPGLAHTLIFFGFLALQPHSLELMLRGIFPGVPVGDTIPRLYGAYLFTADLVVFLVFFGLGYSLYRRLAIRPPCLTDSRDAHLIILFIAVIVTTFFLINALGMIPAIGGSRFDYGRYFTISRAVKTLFGLQGLTPAAGRFAYELCYWVHILTILGFLVYIPGSKHLHMLAAVPNVFWKPLERPKPMIKTDLEAEGTQTYGLGQVSDLTWKGVLDLYACTECGRCEEQCPAAMTGKPLSPKRVVHDAKVDLFGHSETILERRFDAVKPLVRVDSPITSEVLWSCTTCRACEDICPVNIQHLDLLLEARKHQVLMEASFPPELQESFTNLENQSNPWGFGSDTRADWAKGLDVPRLCDRPEAGLLFFVGCAGSFDDRGKKISRAMAGLLKKAGVDFAILGEEERCNGDVARRCGNEYLAQMMIRENAAVLTQYKPGKILAGCPHCYNILKHEYPQFGARFEVVHAAEFILDLFRQGRLTVVADAVFQQVAFHDSCYLGRWNGLFGAPRELLRIIAGGPPLELGRSGELGLCCGAGGGRMFMEEKIGRRINAERVDEILSSGAVTAAAACPFCITMLRDGLAERGSTIEVKDIVELVDLATG